ncbi:hypothetical protein P9X10_00630 [Bacillus cereus]|nr:hypothetical protein [Bacillus cereus]
MTDFVKVSVEEIQKKIVANNVYRFYMRQVNVNTKEEVSKLYFAIGHVLEFNGKLEFVLTLPEDLKAFEKSFKENTPNSHMPEQMIYELGMYISEWKRHSDVEIEFYIKQEN